MSEHIVQSYEDELNALQLLINYMGNACAALVSTATEALMAHDKALAAEAVKLDRGINDQQQAINVQAQSILALRSPVATDLRVVITSIQVSSDLERIGDLGKNIAKIVKNSDVVIGSDVRALVQQMGDLVLAQLNEVMGALHDTDEGRAQQIYHSDLQVDECHNRISALVMTKLKENSETIDSDMGLLFVIRHLERIGDHVKNIAEATIYVATGEMNRFDMFDDLKN